MKLCFPCFFVAGVAVSYAVYQRVRTGRPMNASLEDFGRFVKGMKGLSEFVTNFKEETHHAWTESFEQGAREAEPAVHVEDGLE